MSYVHPRTVYADRDGGVDVLLYSFFKLEVVRGQSAASGRYFPWERDCTHCTGGRVDRRVGLHWGAENLFPTEIRSPDVQM